MKSFGRFFRRQSQQQSTALKEDYPTHSESDDVTDDETIRREWENHLKRRATLSSAAASNLDNDLHNWDVHSENNAAIFSSDSSIIDAYHEGKYRSDDGEFDNVLKNAVSYERKHSGDKYSSAGPRHSLYPNDGQRNAHKGPQTLGSRSPRINERVRDIEEQQKFGRRRASCAPGANTLEAPNKRPEKKDRYATWNDTGAKRKIKKHIKNRKRAHAHELSFDASDDESKYTVNLTMEDLNSIIKRNINSAVKTIISATSKVNKSNVRPLSPTDSFSTETETIFSGSSNQSSDLHPGTLHKQISWQLDSERLKGGRRKSQVTLQIPTGLDHDQHMSLDGRRQSIVHSYFPRITEAPPSPYLDSSAEPGLGYLQQQYHHQQTASLPSPIPPPPPLPPPQPSTAPPQVTFNLTPQQPTGFPGMSNQIQYPHNPMFSAQPVPNVRPSIDYSADPYGQAMADIMAGNRSMRRHTLASLGAGDRLLLTENTLDSKVEQLNSVLNLLDKNIKQAETDPKPSITSNNSNTPLDSTVQSSLDQAAASTTQDVPSSSSSSPANVITPILSIADQIAALSKKKKKPLKPGQIKMSSCAKAILVLTNIVFLMIGGGVTALGMWLMMDPKIEHYFAVLNIDKDSQDFKSICYALTVVGAFIVTIAFTGCCGTMKSSRCLLTAFLVMITVITLAEVGLGVLVFIQLDSPTAIPILSAIFSDMETNLKTILTRSIVEKYDPTTMIGTTWNLVQKQMECCGATGPDDYKLSAWKNDTTNELTIPDECCVLMNKDAEVPEPSNKLLCQIETIGFFHKTGCFDMMITWFKTNSKYILAAGLASVGVEIFAFVSAVIICQKGKRTEAKPNDDNT